MTAPNHALTGALIGLSIANPWLALPLAFLSHLAQDAIPHYDPPTQGAERIGSRRFIIEQLVIGAALCFLLVVCLAITRPQHWVLAAICAFLAASPDLFWIPKFVHVMRTKQDLPPKNLLLRFHAAVQWKTGPKFIIVEAIWFVCVGALVAAKL